MIKIAILVRAETSDKCTGAGCLRSFNNKTESFERYKDLDVELVGFCHTGGDLNYKLEKLKKNGVQVIHVSTCMRAKYKNYEELVRTLSLDFDVVGYTHGSADGKKNNTLSITGKYID